MEEYPKIQSIFKRDEKTHKFIEGEFSLPEFEYLKDNVWVATEKVDGTNIRVMLKKVEIFGNGQELIDTQLKVTFAGKSDNAQIPTFLLTKLQNLFTVDKLKDVFSETEVYLYGEGYGAKIQKSGGNYIPNDVDFILFDVKTGNWWLKREDVEEIAARLGIKVVPIAYRGDLGLAVALIKAGFQSDINEYANANCRAEGLVLKPEVELRNRRGERIITKMKTKDF